MCNKLNKIMKFTAGKLFTTRTEAVHQNTQTSLNNLTVAVGYVDEYDNVVCRTPIGKGLEMIPFAKDELKPKVKSLNA